MSGRWASVWPVAGASTAKVRPSPLPFWEMSADCCSTVAIPAPSSVCGAGILSGAVLRLGVELLHARRDPAEHRVLAVEPRRRVGGHDEELAAVRVGARVGHRERAADDL